MILELIDAVRARVGGGSTASHPRPAAARGGSRTGTALIFIAILAMAVALVVSAVVLLVALRTLDVARSTLAAANGAADDAHRYDLERLASLEQTARALEQDLTVLQRLNATAARQNTAARAGFTAAVRAAGELQAQLLDDLTLTKSQLAALATERTASGSRRPAMQSRPQLVFTVYSKFNGTLSDPAPANRATFPARADGSPLTIAIGIRNAGTRPLLHAVVTAAAAYPASASVQAFFRANDPTHAQTTDLTTSRSSSDPYVLLVSVTPNGQKTLRITVNASGTAEDGTPYAATPSFSAIIAEPSHS